MCHAMTTIRVRMGLFIKITFVTKDDLSFIVVYNRYYVETAIHRFLNYKLSNTLQQVNAASFLASSVVSTNVKPKPLSLQASSILCFDKSHLSCANTCPFTVTALQDSISGNRTALYPLDVKVLSRS